MLPLADVQQRLRNAVVADDFRAAAPLLIGGVDATRRLAIHRRHYETSLVAALMGRFPATAWLMGTAPIEDAARRFVHIHPPTAPCIAEYGRHFGVFLAAEPGAERVPYLQSFAELDWHLGRLAVAVDLPAASRDEVAAVPPLELANARLTIQAGTHYVEASHPIDDLIRFYLANDAPERLELPDMSVWVEVRGARGAFRFARLTPAAFAFRASLANGLSIGDSVARAWVADASFDPGAALALLVDAGLVTGIDGQWAARN
ncbi:MAG: hypothetical protein A3G25_03760 [Betaproteobacteria bacterium RIFCSPLOWO2_12_FULL_63_13]|nr:MAG: hypothetical protein A3G25_03760 [Betaproteobacteria bacterium RIFCSPLOWO2_12_FULL_63_13]